MTTTTEIKGKVKGGFERVKDAFEANFADGADVGASLAVMIDGEMVVDLWGGHADGGCTRPWEQDTIVNTFSTTKGLTALCANQLIEQGKLDPEEPVATYWPEFAQAGKEKLPVKYLLNHKAGLPAVDRMLSPDEQYKWESLVDALAAQKPWWTPGEKHGYHAVTFGSLVGEVIRRVSGMSVGTYLRKNVTEPLGVDYYIGYGPELDAQTADMIPQPFQTPEPDHPLYAAFTNPQSMTFKAFMISPLPMLNPNYMNTREWRAAEVPAANGHGNARALATIYGALARGGELNGVRLLQSDTIDEMRKEQSNGVDQVLTIPMRFGRGFFLELPEYELTKNTTLFGHPGMGGSFGLADPEAKIGIGYAMNKMYMPPDLVSVDPRWMPIFSSLYASI
ncbi:MAG: serine hydrolase domain-containing protein [Chloroflexota bacterium]